MSAERQPGPGRSGGSGAASRRWIVSGVRAAAGRERRGSTGCAALRREPLSLRAVPRPTAEARQGTSPTMPLLRLVHDAQAPALPNLPNRFAVHGQGSGEGWRYTSLPDILQEESNGSANSAEGPIFQVQFPYHAPHSIGPDAVAGRSGFGRLFRSSHLRVPGNHIGGPAGVSGRSRNCLDQSGDR